MPFNRCVGDALVVPALCALAFSVSALTALAPASAQDDIDSSAVEPDAIETVLDGETGLKRHGAGDFLITGEAKSRLENFVNPDSIADDSTRRLPQGIWPDQTFTQVLLRTRLSALWWASDVTYGKITLEDRRAWGQPPLRANGQFTNIAGTTTLFEGFMHAAVDDVGFDLVLGRQVVEFDDGMLVSSFDSHLGNTGVSNSVFGGPIDAARARWQIDGFGVEAFWSVLAEDRIPNGNEIQLWGIHTTTALGPVDVSVYLFGLFDEIGAFGFAKGDPGLSVVDHEVYTLGAFVTNIPDLAGSNLSRKHLATNGGGGGYFSGANRSADGPISFRATANWQFGNRHDARIAAWMLAGEAWFALGSVSGETQLDDSARGSSLQVGISGGIASGDNTPTGVVAGAAGTTVDTYTAYTELFTDYGALGPMYRQFPEGQDAEGVFPRLSRLFNLGWMGLMFRVQLEWLTANVSWHGFWIQNATGRDSLIRDPTAGRAGVVQAVTSAFRNWELGIRLAASLDPLFDVPVTLVVSGAFLKMESGASSLGLGDNTGMFTLGVSFTD